MPVAIKYNHSGNFCKPVSLAVYYQRMPMDIPVLAHGNAAVSTLDVLVRTLHYAPRLTCALGCSCSLGCLSYPCPWHVSSPFPNEEFWFLLNLLIFTYLDLSVCPHTQVNMNQQIRWVNWTWLLSMPLQEIWAVMVEVVVAEVVVAGSSCVKQYVPFHSSLLLDSLHITYRAWIVRRHFLGEAVLQRHAKHIYFTAINLYACIKCKYMNVPHKACVCQLWSQWCRKL